VNFTWQTITGLTQRHRFISAAVKPWSQRLRPAAGTLKKRTVFDPNFEIGATRQNLSPSIRVKAQAKALREIRKQTKNFSTHWAEFSAAGLAKVKDLEPSVKRKLVAAVTLPGNKPIPGLENS
jgi:hypothetical protein